MPTAVPLISRAADAAILRAERRATESNQDFVVVVAILSAIGLVLAIALTWLFPLVANDIVLNVT